MNILAEKSKNSIGIFLAGRRIGIVRGDTFYKSISPNHYLTRPRAICFSLDSLAQAEQAGARRVAVTDRETGVTYKAAIAHIRARGFPVNRGGFEAQIGLELTGFTREGRGERQLELFCGGGA